MLALHRLALPFTVTPALSTWWLCGGPGMKDKDDMAVRSLSKKFFGWRWILRLDPYIALILLMVVVASALPARGEAAHAMGLLTKAAIGFLFFLYGGRLSREAIVSGLTNWRLQLLVLASTFLLFPVLASGLDWLLRPLLGTQLAFGLMFLAVLPSTVQSSIAFTSIARGNVPAAICAASISNLAGVVITPVAAGLLAGHGSGVISTGAIWDIILQLLAPFAAGQALRPLIRGWLERNRQILGLVDRGSILLVVYTAFSAGVVGGLWQKVDLARLGIVMAAAMLLLAVVLFINTWVSRRFGFARADEITIVFCGSKKSLASGLPMANILFSAQSVGMIVLPLMLYHQIQLMACAWLAQRYARTETVVD